MRERIGLTMKRITNLLCENVFKGSTLRGVINLLDMVETLLIFRRGKP